MWAVGDSNYGSSLTEHWNGKSWTIVPNLPFLDELNAVAWIPGTRQFIAAGRNGGHGFSLRWRRGEWEPDVHPRKANFYGAAARSRRDAWLVGDHTVDEVRQPYALHWDGDEWRSTDVPTTNDFYPSFNDVDIVPGTRHQAWAVGATFSGGEAFTFRWASGHWKRIPNPFANLPLGLANLEAVEAIAKDDVWVVGSQLDETNPEFTDPLIAHWDGTSWQVDPTMSNHVGHPMSSIAALGPNDIWAITGSGLFFHWNGFEWTTVSVPVPGINRLQDIVRVPGTSVLWAVGQTWTDKYRTLALRYCAPSS